MAPTSLGLDEFIQQLKSPRFIKIFVGSLQEPCHIPESTLVSASGYFAKAIEHEHSLSGSEPGVLRFPEDEGLEEAWSILLYWIVNNKLPGECESEASSPFAEGNILKLVHAWILGDKYFLPKLQDHVMLELLYETWKHGLDVDHDEIYQMLQISPVGSSLRRLLVEEVIQLHRGEDADEPNSIMDYFESHDGIFGLAGSIMRAYEYHLDDNRVPPRARDD